MAPPQPSVFSKNPNFSIPNSPSTTQQIPSKSLSNNISKTLVIVLILLVIPLFPSQPPDFISQSFLNEFWEIFHLLFIGIAVSYGLFCRKNAETVTQQAVHSRNDESNEYLSGISNLASIFEDGFENLCGSDEKILGENYANSDSQFLGEKVRSFVSKNGINDISEGNVKRVTQSWRSRYSKGESLVVVSNGKYCVDENPDFKPLNLPIRRLRSSIVDNDRVEVNDELDSSPEITAKGIDDLKVLKFRGVVPKNLEKKFEEVVGPSVIPWRSKSVREMVNGGDIRNFTRSQHCRPQSVGEIKFENVKSSSREIESSKIENNRTKREFRQPVILVPKTKVGPRGAEVSFNGEKTRPFSIGSSLEMNKLRNSEYNSNKYGDCGEEGNLGRGKFLDLDMKPAGLTKVLLKAKSVRTIKPGRYLVDRNENFEVDSSVKRGTRQEPNDPKFNHQNQEFDGIFPMPKPKPILPEIRKEDMDDRNFTDSEEETSSEFDKSSDEDNTTETNLESDVDCLGSEVDRKAGEFIAKFKQQIRLQKTSSVKSYSGL